MEEIKLKLQVDYFFMTIDLTIILNLD